jgi:hypothetical protein
MDHGSGADSEADVLGSPWRVEGGPEEPNELIVKGNKPSSGKLNW